jgi:hypothetical protein
VFVSLVLYSSSCKSRYQSATAQTNPQPIIVIPNEVGSENLREAPSLSEKVALRARILAGPEADVRLYVAGGP